MCEFPGDKMDAATESALRNANATFDKMFGVGASMGARAAQQARMAGVVRDARATALRDQAQWIDALHNLTPAQEIAITHAVMHGDHAEAGRLLRDALQAYVLEQATDRAKERIEEQSDVAA